jgi:hypothetical protein
MVINSLNEKYNKLKETRSLLGWGSTAVGNLMTQYTHILTMSWGVFRVYVNYIL